MTATQHPPRHGHATMNLGSRRAKAEKIENLLQLCLLGRPLRLLEIGCGSGGIAHYFATHPDLHCQVTGVDVTDTRQIFDGYAFVHVQGAQLPFDDGAFDVVISNHVIEHVGTTADQLLHLKEIRRVLAASGSAYLAVPNRWMLTEPHYRLKLLSWWPRSWRSTYLRWMGKGSFYDCEPLQMQELERLLTQAGLHYSNQSVQGWRATFDIEYPGRWSTRLLQATPDAVLRPLRPIIPTLIYRLQRTAPVQANASSANQA